MPRDIVSPIKYTTYVYKSKLFLQFIHIDACSSKLV